MILCNLLLLLTIFVYCECKRYWTYDILGHFTETEDETKMKFDIRVERKSRDQMGITGTMDVQYDLDNTTMFEVQILRSVSGAEDDFRPLPMAVPKQRIIDLKKLYDDIVYPVMKDCSNMPKIEGDKLLPWPKRIYTFNMCNFDNGNLPEIMAEGYYKVKCICEGEVRWSVIYFLQIKTQLIY